MGGRLLKEGKFYSLITMEVPRLPIHLIDEIITMSVKTDHKEKSKNMHRQLSCKFQCCGKITTLPLFMHLKFIGDIDFEPNPIKGSNFSKITDDYEDLYMSYIPDYDDEEDYSDEYYEYEMASRYDFL